MPSDHLIIVTIDKNFNLYQQLTFTAFTYVTDAGLNLKDLSLGTVQAQK